MLHISFHIQFTSHIELRRQIRYGNPLEVRPICMKVNLFLSKECPVGCEVHKFPPPVPCAIFRNFRLQTLGPPVRSSSFIFSVISSMFSVPKTCSVE